MQLEPTGERMIVEHYAESPSDYLIYLMHVATYRFAEQYTRGKRVLDYGCGSGYGSAEIAETANDVVGVDISEDAVAHARSHFRKERLRFDRVDPDAKLPFGDGTFDTVLSFQVFEHVRDTTLYLNEVYRVLAPGGTLVLATPDRSTRLLPMQKPWNRWHLKEYSQEKLRLELSRVFTDVQILGMSGRREVIDIELRRYRKLKWVTLPITLPFVPESVRIWTLNLMHRMRSSSGEAGTDGNSRAHDFGLDDISIGPGLHPSLNVIAVARRN